MSRYHNTHHIKGISQWTKRLLLNVNILKNMLNVNTIKKWKSSVKIWVLSVWMF